MSGERAGGDRDRGGGGGGTGVGGSRLGRRDFLLGAAASLAAPLLGACGEPAPRASMPNVILMTADDLGWLDLGCYGNDSLSTPGLDRLAAEGVRFTRAFGATSSCSSARATFITGQLPHTHGVTGLVNKHRLLSLRPFRDTLASLLARAGAHTAIAGKWHVAAYLPPWCYGYRERIEAREVPDSRAAVAFLRRNREQPFYLELNFIQNHRDGRGHFGIDPAHPVDADRVQVPSYLHLPDWPEIRADLARFYSETEQMDAIVGEILVALDDLGLAERTLVMFVSDNGPPYPGSKMTLYDRGIGTPLLMRWPGRLPAGSTVEDLASTMDLLPTALDAAGLPVPSWVQGVSLLPRMQGSTTAPPHDAIFAEMTWHVDYIPMRAVRTPGWKYIRNYNSRPTGLDLLAAEPWAQRLCELPDQPWLRPRQPEELYDLAADPEEQVNLAGRPEHAARQRELAARLEREMAETADPFVDQTFVDDAGAPAAAESGAEG